MPTVKVTARGIAAHAGNHHADGANAIWALCRFILRADDDVRFTEIEGGQSRNTVPDHATVLMTCSEAQLESIDLTSDVPNTTLSL